MKSLTSLGLATLVLAGDATAFAQGAAPAAATPTGSAPMVELKVGDKAPNFKLQGLALASEPSGSEGRQPADNNGHCAAYMH